ncbi:uncharacterized protein LOC116211803 isoform X1 [Punica granatum]|uniref:Uncharacterized protein LOC116211803 isoform X1 n=1 Tax=Punica granatum TaxID=22663 RepID=A0A6P8EAB8_PUNGR|nr:uncharacterized protein LOC116211803 isoform X1 [Punica granatum]
MPDQLVTCDESGTSVYVVYFHPAYLAPKDLKTESLYTIHAFPVTHLPHEPLPQQPVLTLRPRDLPIGMGFACIGSSIYMIGGRWCFPSPRKDPSLDVYILDTRLLPPATSHPVENPLAYLRKGPSLRAPKIDPLVIPLLGKLYLLPKSFAPSSSDKDGPWAEVFDPCSDEWVSLPEPKLDPDDFTLPSDYIVRSCNAMGSCIVLMLGCYLVYELDCNHPCEGWKKSSRFGWLPEVQQTRGSEVVDGLWYPWFPFPWFPFPSHLEGACLLACDLAQENKDRPPEFIPVRHTGPGKIGSKIYSGQRRVLDIGGGQAVIFSCGFIKNTDLMAHDYGKLRFTFDVVRLEKKTGADERKRKQRGNPKGRFINCVLLRSLSYVVGEVGSSGYLCGCFPMFDEGFWLLPLSVVPFLGPALYLILRPWFLGNTELLLPNKNRGTQSANVRKQGAPGFLSFLLRLHTKELPMQRLDRDHSLIEHSANVLVLKSKFCISTFL